MAVEAGHHTLLNPQHAFDNQAKGNTPSGYGIGNPLPPTMYCSGFTDAFPSNATAESGLTCSLPVSRKGARDINAFVNMNQNPIGRYTFLGEDISLQIQQQQLEMERFVAHHTAKVRQDIEERRTRNSKRIIAAVEEGISKKLRAKEEEIVKMARLNWMLEEKVKSLCVENQIWRELAQTNEATANALRSNLKQVLEQDEYRRRSTTDDAAEDAQSCCQSNRGLDDMNDDCSISNTSSRLCHKCGQEESCVLLLPCRHLCLCTVCASSSDVCPICKSTKNTSVHVIMS